MRHHGPHAFAVALSLALCPPALAQGSPPGQGPPPGGEPSSPRPVRIDPEQDEVLQTIRAALSPSARQMEQFVELYTSLRQGQRRVLTEMRRAMRARVIPGGEPEGDRRGQRLTREDRIAARKHAMEQLKALGMKFLDGCRALLSPEQIEAWDDCTGDLDLMPTAPGAVRGRGREGPNVGDAAPDFELRDLKGNTVSLSSLRGKPVVLEFGSYTCPVFRRNVDKIEQLRRHFGDDVSWVLVYTKEAHPTDGWVSRANTRQGIEIPQHTSFEKRLDCASLCVQRMDLQLAVLVDGLDDKVTKAYRGHPNRGYVIDAEGRVVSRQAWIDPDRTRRVLRELLEPAATTAPADSDDPPK